MKKLILSILKRVFFLFSIFTVCFAQSALRLLGGATDDMPLLYRTALSPFNPDEIREIIKTHGKGLDLSDGKETDTVPHLLIRQGGGKQLILLREILNSLDVDVNKYSYTLLHEAASRPDPSAVIMLVDEFKAHINAVDDREKGIFTTPLHVAAWHGYTETVKALVEREADRNAQNSRGQIPLHLAAEYGEKDSHEWTTTTEKKELFKLLSDQNTINTQDKKGRTSLHLAASYGQFNSIKALLALGANAHITDNEGNLPYDVAKARADDVDSFSDSKYKISAKLLKPAKWVHTASERAKKRVKPAVVANANKDQKSSWVQRGSAWCKRVFSKR